MGPWRNGSAPPWHGGGSGFKSRRVHKFYNFPVTIKNMVGYQRELEIKPVLYIPNLNNLDDILKDDYIESIIAVAMENPKLLDTHLSWWGIHSEEKITIRELIEKSSIGIFEDYIDVYKKVIEENSLPFKIVNVGGHYKIKYFGDKRDIEKHVLRFTEEILEENPDAMYGLNTYQDGERVTLDDGLLIDKDGKPIQLNFEEPVNKKPLKGKKLFAILAGIGMIGAAAAAGVYYISHQSKITANIIDFYVKPKGIVYGEIPVSTQKALYINAWINDTVPIEKIIIYYGKSNINQTPMKKPVDLVWVPIMNYTFNNKKVHIYDEFEINHAQVTYLDLEMDTSRPYRTLFKMVIIDKVGNKLVKEFNKAMYDIPPQIISIADDGHHLVIYYKDPDNGMKQLTELNLEGGYGFSYFSDLGGNHVTIKYLGNGMYRLDVYNPYRDPLISGDPTPIRIGDANAVNEDGTMFV